jgi:mannosyltransferase
MPATREPALVDSPNTRSGLSSTQIALSLALLTLAGAWLRLAHLGSKSLWLDEGATVALARASWPRFAWIWWHGEANLQTLYFLLMRGWIHGGNSEAWLRLPSALCGIVSIPLLYGVARKFVGSAPALAAAALLAFNPTHVYYSQEARSYTLTILMAILSAYFFVRAVEGNRTSDWALWTVCGIAAFYCHDFAALVLVAQAASLLFFFPQGKFPAKTAPWKRLIACGAIIFVTALPGLTYVFRASPENLHFAWMPRPSAREFWHLAMFFGGGGVKVVVAVILWMAGVFAIGRNRYRQAPDLELPRPPNSRSSGQENIFWQGMLILLWAVLPALLLALISLRQPMFLPRYVIFSLPGTILLAAMGMDVLRRGKTGLILVVLLCGMSVLAVVGEYSKPREDWRAATNLVLTEAAPGDAVVFFPFYSRVMMDYYRDRYGATAPALNIFAPAYYAGGGDVRDLLDALRQNPQRFRQVWILLSDNGANLDSFAYGAAAREKLQSVYGAPAEWKVADIVVMKYGR